MVSLYVCDFPQNLEKEELSAIFQDFEGYVETRTARDRSGQKIAFVDYTNRENAQFALQSCLGYRFHGSNKGITLRMSENSKSTNIKSEPSRNNNSSAAPSKQKNAPKSILKSANNSAEQMYNQQAHPLNSLSNLDIPVGSLTQIQSLISQLKDNPDPALQSQLYQIQSLLGQINPEISHQQQPPGYSHQISQQQHQFQQHQQGYSYDPFQPNFQQPIYNKPSFYSNQSAPSDNSGLQNALQSIVESLNPSKMAVDFSMKKIVQLASQLKPRIPANATTTVYVEGLPANATEREVAHLFRPYPGFKQIRLIPRENKDNQRVYLCFADFENTEQTTVVLQTMQGYRFDKDDLIGLQFSYATKSGYYK